MAVLPKYALKLLFESGDLITQSTLYDLIDATYNPTLVAGTNITLNQVITPSGTTVTINSTGGGSGVVTSLTTNGTSGAATLNSSTGVLNIPNYAVGGGVGSYTNLTPTPLNFPGNSPFDTIIAGTTFNNQTFTEMMNAMLYPTLDPTLTPPSNTMTISPNATYQEIGANITVALNATFNQGLINPQYTATSNKRSGLPNTYNYTGAQVTSNSSTSLSDSESTGAYIVLAGTNTWTGSVSYDAGVQPKDSVGGDFDSPLPAGTTTPAISKTITGVYPVFATTSNIATMTKQSLVSMSGYATVSLVAESFATGSARQTVDIPIAGGGQVGWSTITIVEFFNTFSNQWGSAPLGDWTQSATTHEVPSGSGTFINYTRFTNNAGYPRGAGQYRFKS